ncbi:putative rhomboid protease YdcA [Sporosarcina luteola]|uniref:Putative rhomboid protease YdcA n=1 Tax=Sporosarcina luteola TaxID=582850 RepID=A0A511ZBI4_9BACL|nr:rhomboid family intramembrane serine protease [Sporosarcina luteola]GEN84809.1 putative rhomboid protease YdcA [Sporosarcina luteola]
MFIRTESFSQYIRLYPFVTALLAINVLVYIVTGLPIHASQKLYYSGIGINYLISDGEWWRLITPMFLHAGLMHLLFNMFSLFIFGPELERVAGKARFLTIYLLSGLFANVASFFLGGWDFSHVGASGAIFGIFGAFGALVHYTKKAFPQLRQIILPIIVISVIMTFLQPGVNVIGHIAGLIVGFIIGLSYFHPKRIISWR